ncbi:MAG TPA: glutamate-1-semialdehyde 2,1-aminomutase, partial [Candidatus Dormibacteraeota bacterium]|nr:glutamate-1-semialdehyde 2,1-aminomutase [Candidatus Dormibacteraeota bacterium]
GPLLFGHAHPAIVKAISGAATRGTSFGTPTEAESELAESIIEFMPAIERLRFTSSGTEATMSAVRLARGFTGRSKIVKFAGSYHGAADSFLIAAGSSALTLGVPNSPGVTTGTASDTLVAKYNDLAALRATFAANPNEIAAVIVEPLVGNMGFIAPLPDFLPGLRALCDKYKTLLIFDEVMTGFRVGAGGAQERFGVRPDLTTLGKVIGGGLPVGAFGGRADIMAHLTPDGSVFHAGTLSGNPIAMAAGIAALRMIREDRTIFERLEILTGLLVEGMRELFGKYELPYCGECAGSMFGFYFADGPIHDLESAMRADTTSYAQFFHAMLERGIYLAPSQFEAGFVSTAHTTRDIEQTLHAADDALAAMERVR